MYLPGFDYILVRNTCGEIHTFLAFYIQRTISKIKLMKNAYKKEKYKKKNYICYYAFDLNFLK